MLLRLLCRLTGSLLSGSAVALLFTALVQLFPDPTVGAKHSPTHAVAHAGAGPAQLGIQRAPPTEPAGAAVVPAALPDRVPEATISPAADRRDEADEAGASHAAVEAAPDRLAEPGEQQGPESGMPQADSGPAGPATLAAVAPAAVEAATGEKTPGPGPVSEQEPAERAPAVAAAAAGEAHGRPVAADQARRTAPAVRGPHGAHPRRGRIEGAAEHRRPARQAQHRVQD
jgi:hypothetical protein